MNFSNPKTEKALEYIVEERDRQRKLWGEESHHMFEWLSILGEEYGELCQAVNEHYLSNQRYPELGTTEVILTEATHVAAIATAILEGMI